MCGIVGYVGNNDAVEVVLEGLSRLEYRGYDSAGVSVKMSDGLQIVKKEGKLDNLKNVLKSSPLKTHFAIGHTRWATHGQVNDTNAHPHGNDQFSVVHNGIIENASEIRSRLQNLGHKFLSQTDSESFLVLLTHEAESAKDTEEAIRKTFKQLKGNSAFVILENKSNKIYSIKRSAPLVCGTNNTTSEVFVSSDPYALVGFAKTLFFPEDEVLCVGESASKDTLFHFYELDGRASKRVKSHENDATLSVQSKGKYEHFMLKEIHEQPQLVNKLVDIYLTGAGRAQMLEVAKNKPEFMHIVACGTALHAGMVIKNYFEQNNSMRTITDYASEFRYREQPLLKTEQALFISQSGETADTLACQELCAENKLVTNSIVNVKGSTLYRNCDQNLLIHAGQEIGVASTKAFTLQVLVGLLLSRAYAGELDHPELRRELELLANRIDGLLARSDELKEVAHSIYNYDGFIFTGRGLQFPIALEGALKLKEIAYVHAEGYAAGELKHGPISLFDENMVNIAIVTPDLYDKTLSNAQEVKARRGILVIIGDERNSELKEIADYFIGLPLDGLKDTVPVLTNVVLQLLSYYVAKLKGTDIDKPRNLAKSVTVE